MRSAVPPVIALVIAVAFVSWNHAHSRAQRVTNLRLNVTLFPDTYLVFSKTDKRRCFVVDRRDATMRRDDARQPGLRWDCRSFDSEKEGIGKTWLLQSKRIRQGTVFLVPAREVRDWTYPFFYDFVSRQNPRLRLPRVTWTQLYRDRLYQGLYLWVSLPFDRRKKDGGSGVLRELLTVDSDSLSVVSTRFTETRDLFVDAVSNGVFPVLEPPPPLLSWLAARMPGGDCTFLMSNQEPFSLSVLPLPVSLRELYWKKNGRPPPTFQDARYVEWVERARANGETDLHSVFSEQQLVALRHQFEAYASDLVAALRAEAGADLTEESIQELFEQRQMAIEDLHLLVGTSS